MVITTFRSLLSACTIAVEKARLKAVTAPHAGDWLNAPPITAVGLRLSDEAVRDLDQLYVNHICGTQVDARGLHGLSCRKSRPQHIRHLRLNDLIWRVMRKAQIPATKEPVGLSRTDEKRPDGATLTPWTRGKPNTNKRLAWDVTVADTYAQSHIAETAENAGTAATKAAVQKSTNYACLTATHHFVPIAIETGGPWNSEAAELVTDLGRRITQVTLEPLEAQYLFQRISITLQRGDEIAFRITFKTE